MSPGSSWELSVRADQRDPNGLDSVTDSGTLNAIGPAAILIPALTALSGGRVGAEAALPAMLTGEFLRSQGLMLVNEIVWQGITARVTTRAGDTPDVDVAVDYTVKYNIDAELGDLGPDIGRLQTTRPIEVTFRNVGVSVIDGRPYFTFDPSQGFSLDVNDPGVFRLGEGIGRILNVRRVRAGAGSPLWFEVELGLALETSIFTLDTLRLRISLDVDQLFPLNGDPTTLPSASLSLSDFDVSINKIGVGVKVPGVLEGKGALGFSPGAGGGTDIDGAVDVKIVPLKMQIDGSLAIRSEPNVRGVYAGLGVQFAPGIPLGTTGAAVFGFSGLLGANMTRTPAENALQWYKNPTVGVGAEKFALRAGNWAFGVGTVVGTAYDNGFTFNTKGSFIIEVPGPRFLLATESQFLTPAPEVGSSDSGTIISTVLLDFEAKILQINMELAYNAANLIDLRVPVDVFFNLGNARDWHIRLGEWSPQSKRIAMTILGLYRAWGYLNLEGNGLHNGPLDLEGISFGTGARTEILWGSRSVGIYLEAFFEYHVGVQLSPIFIQGELTVGGELHLGPVSIGARGHLSIKAPDPFVVHGEVCGSVDLWLFEIEGCVGVTIGDGSAEMPAPQNPFKELVPIDRMTGMATPTTGVPLDALFHATFDQDIIDGRPAPAPTYFAGSLRNQVSNDLYYDWSLTGLSLTRADGTDVPLEQSAWAPYSLPGATPEEVRSQRTLRVLAWQPQAHDRVLDFTSGYEITLQNLISSLCERPDKPGASCATFDEEPLGPGSHWTLDEGPLEPVHVTATSGEAPDIPGAPDNSARVVPLVPVDYAGRAPNDHCLRLPAHRDKDDGLGDLFRGGGGGGRAAAFERHVRLSARELSRVSVSGASAAGAAIAEPAGLLERMPFPWRAGLVMLAVPDLVAAHVVIAATKEQRIPGTVMFLDEHMEPLGPAIALTDGEIVDGSVGSGQFSDYYAWRVSFGPPRDSVDTPRARWIAIDPPSVYERNGIPQRAYLMEVCGIRYGDWAEWIEGGERLDHAVLTLEQLTGIIGGVPAASTPTVLERNTEYTMRGTLDWKRFRTATATSHDGEAPAPVEFATTFRTAADEPEEIRRYVAWHDPAGPAQPHYFQERMRITFASDAIDRVFSRFGRQLLARAKADTGGHVVHQPVGATATMEFFPIGGFEQALYDALTEHSGPCLTGDWSHLFPKLVLTFAEDLRPNTGYTVTLLSRPLGETVGTPEWEREVQQQVDNAGYKFRFDARTSRWGTFTEHMDAYRGARVGDVFAGTATAFDAALAAVPDRGDASTDALCAALFGGPLALPARPEIVRVWVETGPGTTPDGLPSYACRAILLDGPEPVMRLRPDGTPSVTPSIERFASETPTGGTALAGARVIASEAGARAFVTFPAAPPPPFCGITLRYARPGAPDITERIMVAIGTTPGSFDEGGI